MAAPTILLLLAMAGRALVIGGNGRVGGSTVRWLLQLASEAGEPLEVAIGGRSQANFVQSLKRLEAKLPSDTAPRVSFRELDLGDHESLLRALEGVDICVHTAGPFQFVEEPTALRACIESGVHYVDVCDNTLLARNARTEYSQGARDAGVSAVVAAGIWPGVSSLMAADAVAQLPDGRAGEVQLSFFTAGTGNAGPSIVAATFHLLCEPVYCLRGGEPVELRPWSDPRRVEFQGHGSRNIYLLDNPDVFCLAETVLRGRVQSMSSRFGTAPQIWNELFSVIALAPASILKDRNLMALATAFSSPVIRAVDRIVGSTNGMRVDAIGEQPSSGPAQRVTVQLIHPDLEDCVGLATAAFARAIMAGKTPLGVSFAAELADTPASEYIVRTARRDGVWEEQKIPL